MKLNQTKKSFFLITFLWSIQAESELREVELERNDPHDDVEVRYQPLEIFTDKLQIGGNGPEMVLVPMHHSSSFECNDQEVCDDAITEIVGNAIVHQYAISRFEITFDEYDKFSQSTGWNLPEDHKWGRGNRPVIFVSWKDGIRYTQWLSKQTGFDYRLPSVLEWEHAARAGTNAAFWLGNEVQANVANCADCESKWSKIQTAPIGSFEANPWGIHDMHGNVTQFAQDCASKRKKLPIRRIYDQFRPEPRYFEDCGHAFVMGSSWNQMMRSGFRNTYSPWSSKNKRFPPPTQLYGVRYQSYSAGIRIVRVM